jgi:hypothetical protein
MGSLFQTSKIYYELDGTATFAALFTVLNEFEQIHFQAFVPTKSLSHIQSSLKGIVKSLRIMD